MEQFRTNIKHILPFLLALVVLISCIPPIQASAASSLTLASQVKILSGWEADVLNGDLREFSISVDAYVYKNGAIVDIVEIFLDPEEPGVLGATLANGSGQDRLWSSSGDHVPCDKCSVNMRTYRIHFTWSSKPEPYPLQEY